MRIYYILVLSLAAAFAQTPVALPLAFDVASIKPAGPLDPGALRSGKMRIGMKVDGAICDIGSFSLKDLIRTAYEVKDYQVAGPDWMDNMMSGPRFNIQATLPEGTTEKQVPQMLQTLLADRFKLVIHREAKDHSVYAMVVGKGGSKLKEAEPDPVVAATESDSAPEAKKGETIIGQGSSQVRISGNMENGKGVTIKGGPQGQMHMTMADGHMRMEAAKMTMEMLAETVSRFVDRPVVNMTDLKGNYQVAFELSMDDLKGVARSMGVATGAGGASGKGSDEVSDPSGASIFMSLQQMGLKLEPRKAPMPMIVVDHIEKAPTEN